MERTREFDTSWQFMTLRKPPNNFMSAQLSMAAYLYCTYIITVLFKILLRISHI